MVGTINVTANAADNVRRRGVQFQVDGANLGAEDTSAPYSASWDTARLPNGPHTITAVARDAAGNRRTSATVPVDRRQPPGRHERPRRRLRLRGADRHGASPTARAGATTARSRGATRTTSGPVRPRAHLRRRRRPRQRPRLRLARPHDRDDARGVGEPVASPAAGAPRCMKEQTGGLVYGLYANTDANRPSAHVLHERRVRHARHRRRWPSTRGRTSPPTYDGATLRLYVNGTQVATQDAVRHVIASTGALRIGGNSIWGEYFHGSIDEVRVYSRALSAAEIQADMSTPIVPAATRSRRRRPPSLTATGSIGQVALTWTAPPTTSASPATTSTAARRAGFTPTRRQPHRAADRHRATPTRAGRRHLLLPRHGRGRGRQRQPRLERGDRRRRRRHDGPDGLAHRARRRATVAGTVTVTANAADNVGVAGVQFRLDGANLGTEDTTRAVLRHLGHARRSPNSNAHAHARSRATPPATPPPPPRSPSPSTTRRSTRPASSPPTASRRPSGNAVTDSSEPGNDGTLTGATRTDRRTLRRRALVQRRRRLGHRRRTRTRSTWRPA